MTMVQHIEQKQEQRKTAQVQAEQNYMRECRAGAPSTIIYIQEKLSRTVTVIV